MSDNAPGISPLKAYQFTIPVELSAQINDVCYWDNMDRSELVRDAVTDYIAERAKRRKSPYLHSPNRGKAK